MNTDKIREALKSARKSLMAWNSIGVPERDREANEQLYSQSPEVKIIDAALASLDEKEGAKPCEECGGKGTRVMGYLGFAVCDRCKGIGQEPAREPVKECRFAECPCTDCTPGCRDVPAQEPANWPECIDGLQKPTQPAPLTQEPGEWPECTRLTETECHAHNGAYCMNVFQCHVQEPAAQDGQEYDVEAAERYPSISFDGRAIGYWRGARDTLAAEVRRLRSRLAEAENWTKFYDLQAQRVMIDRDTEKRRAEAAEALVARLREGLETAKEAMGERRSYCKMWEYKYGEEWDGEDAQIDALLDATKDKS